MKVKIQTTAKILVNHQYVEVPINFEIDIESTNKEEVSHEIYHLLKNASLGFGDYVWEEISSTALAEDGGVTGKYPAEMTYFRPVLYIDDGTNIDYGNAPEELANNEAFLTRDMCEKWLATNGFDPGDYVMSECHDDEIENVKFIDAEGEEIPKEFVNWKFSDRPYWFVSVRTPGTTSNYVLDSLNRAKEYAKNNFVKGCVSLEIYEVHLTQEEKADVNNWEHLTSLTGMDTIGRQIPMILAMCEHLDEDDFDDTATYGEKLQYMSFKRIVEALNNLNEDSYLMTQEQFDKKWQGKRRDDMNKGELRQFLNDCYALYAYYGFLDRLESPYCEGKPEQGQKFEVLRPITVEDCENNPGNWDVETLPLWEIRLEKGNGSKDDDRIRYCYPEEITVLEASKKRA